MTYEVLAFYTSFKEKTDQPYTAVASIIVEAESQAEALVEARKAPILLGREVSRYTVSEMK